jgi:hypothetical protein
MTTVICTNQIPGVQFCFPTGNTRNTRNVLSTETQTLSIKHQYWLIFRMLVAFCGIVRVVTRLLRNAMATDIGLSAHSKIDQDVQVLYFLHQSMHAGRIFKAPFITCGSAGARAGRSVKTSSHPWYNLASVGQETPCFYGKPCSRKTTIVPYPESLHSSL